MAGGRFESNVWRRYGYANAYRNFIDKKQGDLDEAKEKGEVDKNMKLPVFEITAQTFYDYSKVT